MMRPSSKKPKVPIDKVQASKHVNEYIEYCNLVGDNGGLAMS